MIEALTPLKKEVLFILAPFLSNKECIESYFEELKKDFSLILYVPSDHSDKKDYLSYKEEIKDIFSFFKRNDIQRVKGIIGVSFGAKIALEMLQYPSISFDKMILDGLPLYENEEEKEKEFFQYYLEQQHIATTSFHDGKKFFTSLYGETYCKELTNQFIHISEKSIRNIVKDLTHTHILDIPSSLQRKITLLYGQREEIYHTYQNTLEERYPEIEIQVLEERHTLEEDREEYIDLLYSILYS